MDSEKLLWVAGLYLIFALFRLVGFWFRSPLYVKIFNADLSIVFLACGGHYLLTGINAPQWVVNYELWAVVIVGAINVVVANPYSYWQFAEYCNKLQLDSLIYQKKKEYSNVPTIVLQWSSDQKVTILRINKAAQQWFFDNRKINLETNFEGKDWFDFHQTPQTEVNIIRQAIATGSVSNNLIKCYAHDGKTLYLEQTIFAISDNQLIIEWHDITDLKLQIETVKSDHDRQKKENAELKESIKSLADKKLKEIADKVKRLESP